MSWHQLGAQAAADDREQLERPTVAGARCGACGRRFTGELARVHIGHHWALAGHTGQPVAHVLHQLRAARVVRDMRISTGEPIYADEYPVDGVALVDVVAEAEAHQRAMHGGRR